MSAQTPTIYLIAGCNGAGKTTFAREFLLKEVGCANFHNADYLAFGLSPLSPEIAAMKAGRLLLSEFKSLVARRKLLPILEQTFKHQRELLAAEQKLKTQLEALTRLHEVLNEAVRPAYLDGHQLRNDWAGQIMSGGLDNYRLAIARFRERASTAIREFATVLNTCKHLPSIYVPFDKTLTFQAKFYEPIQLFLLALEKLPPNPDRGTISLIDTNGQTFSDAVNELSSWIDYCINLTFTIKTELLEIKEKYGDKRKSVMKASVGT